jgi:hypothetical protein
LQIPQLTGAEITGVAGDQGNYKISLTKVGKMSELEVAAIVVRPAQSRIEKNKTSD